MSAGRAYDPEIAEVVLQAILDGHYTYDKAVSIVHRQAATRAAKLRAGGATADEIAAETKRWAGFTKSSITAWKRQLPQFERDIMDAQDIVALDHVERVLKLGRTAERIAKNAKIGDAEERRVRLLGLKHRLNCEMWAVERRLAVRRTYHEGTPASRGISFPTLPENPRFDRVAPGDDVN